MTEAYRPPASLLLPWQLAITLLPPASKFPGQMIWVTDMHQDFAGVAMPGWAISDGGAWRALRPMAVAKVAMAAGPLAWVPLKHRPIVIVTGALAVGTMTPAFSTVGAANGEEVTIVRQAGGAGILSVLGRTIVAGAALRAVFDGSAWQPVPTAGLL